MRATLIASLAALTLAGCASSILPQFERANRLDCHYTRDGIEWTIDCQAAGRIAVEDGLPSIP